VVAHAPVYKCHCATASELVGFHVREAIRQCIEGLCALTGQAYPLPSSPAMKKGD
jgi:hypothetical protein